MRQSGMDRHHAERVMSEAEGLLEAREINVASSPVLDLIARSQCSAYDCEFVALARELHVLLVTLDRQVLTAFPADAVALGTFARP
jgi:predicted nucleic acid-binding protein